MPDAMTAINRMEARLKKHEEEHKMIKFYEYKKLAELYQTLGNEALYQFYDKKRIESEKQTKPPTGDKRPNIERLNVPLSYTNN
jgi:predicted transcriptional regulator